MEFANFFGGKGCQIPGKTAKFDLNSPHELQPQIFTNAVLHYVITYQNIWSENVVRPHGANK